jgi:phage recombination protein Bet
MTKLTLTEDEKGVLRNGMCIGWPEPYFEEFVKRCEATGLSPFKQQVYGRLQSSREGDEYVKKLVFITSVGALRSIAEETGRFRGRTEPQFAGEELRQSHETQESLRAELRRFGKQVIEAEDRGEIELAKAKQEAIQEVLDREAKNEGSIWKTVWTGSIPPFAARVGVRSVDSSGNEHVTYHTAKFAAYVQKNRDGNPKGLWAGELRDNQLAKCAEAGALRAAFPDDLGGLYVAEEMATKLTAIEQEELGKIQDVGVRTPKRMEQSAELANGAGSSEVVEAGLRYDRASSDGPRSSEAIQDGIDAAWNYAVEGNPLDVKVTQSVSRVVGLHGKPIRDLSEENVRFFAKVSVRAGDENKMRFYRGLYQVVRAMDDSNSKTFEQDLERLDTLFRERISKGEIIASAGKNGTGAKLEERIESARKRQSYAVEKKTQEFVSVERIDTAGRALRVKIGDGSAFVPQAMVRDSEEPGKVLIPKWLFEEKEQEAVSEPRRRSAGVRQ